MTLSLIWDQLASHQYITYNQIYTPTGSHTQTKGTQMYREKKDFLPGRNSWFFSLIPQIYMTSVALKGFHIPQSNLFLEIRILRDYPRYYRLIYFQPTHNIHILPPKSFTLLNQILPEQQNNQLTHSQTTRTNDVSECIYIYIYIFKKYDL